MLERNSSDPDLPLQYIMIFGGSIKTRDLLRLLFVCQSYCTVFKHNKTPIEQDGMTA